MLENWFLPISPELNAFNEHQLGGMIEKYITQMPDLKQTPVVLLGIDKKAADPVRKELYSYSCAFSGLKIADIGNLRKQDASFIIPILEELLTGGILPVILGGSDESALAQYLAYQHKKEPVNLFAIDNAITYASDGNTRRNLWNIILDEKKGHLFHAGVIGTQSHLTSAMALKAWEKYHFDYLRLGKIKSEIGEAEPIIRDADLIVYHMAAIKGSEAPGQSQPVSSGMTTEEACQLSRYAGMNDKLSSVGFYGFIPAKDIRHQTAQVVAQLIWYFLEGFSHRKNDYPVSTAHLVEYIVDAKDSDFQLTFWKSNKSGRWWMQIPVKTKRKHQRHRLIPCSYADYELACREELPERLFNAIKRF